MKVALVNQPWNAFLPPIDAGSIAIWNDRVARELAARGLDVVVLGGTDSRAETEIVEAGVRFRAVPLGWDRRFEKWARRRQNVARRPRVLSRRGWAGFRRRLCRALRSERPGVVHVHNLVHLAGPIRAVLPDARIVVHMHCEWLSQLDHDWIAAMLDPADAVVACSPQVAASACAAHPCLHGRAFTVPNGVDTDAFTPETREPGGVPHIVFVGRLTPEKGLHVLLRAFNRVLARAADARLTIVGPEGITPRALLADLASDPAQRALGDLANARYVSMLEDLAAPLGEHVRFAGAIPQRALPAVYRDADVVTLPSFYESFGIPVIEAMACGRAVVAGRAGGMVDLITDGTDGVLVPPGNEAALADSLVLLLEEPDRRERLGANGRTTAIARFAWPRVVDRLLDVWFPAGAP